MELLEDFKYIDLNDDTLPLYYLSEIPIYHGNIHEQHDINVRELCLNDLLTTLEREGKTVSEKNILEAREHILRARTKLREIADSKLRKHIDTIKSNIFTHYVVYKWDHFVGRYNYVPNLESCINNVKIAKFNTDSTKAALESLSVFKHNLNVIASSIVDLINAEKKELRNKIIERVKEVKIEDFDLMYMNSYEMRRFAIGKLYKEFTPQNKKYAIKPVSNNKDIITTVITDHEHMNSYQKSNYQDFIHDVITDVLEYLLPKIDKCIEIKSTIIPVHVRKFVYTPTIQASVFHKPVSSRVFSESLITWFEYLMRYQSNCSHDNIKVNYVCLPLYESNRSNIMLKAIKIGVFNLLTEVEYYNIPKKIRILNERWKLSKNKCSKETIVQYAEVFADMIDEYYNVYYKEPQKLYGKSIINVNTIYLKLHAEISPNETFEQIIDIV